MKTHRVAHTLLTILAAAMVTSQAGASNLSRTPATIRQSYFESDDHAEVGCNFEKSDCFFELKLGRDVRRYLFDLSGMGYTPPQIDRFDFWENSGWSNFNVALDVPCAEGDAEFFGRSKYDLECRLWLAPEGSLLVAEKIDVRVYGGLDGKTKTRWLRPK